MAGKVQVAVESSYFLQLTKTGNGGALEITSQAKNVQVNNCFFEELCVSQSGGSIYISSNSTIVYCCKFHRSYSTDRRDADGSGTSLGNVFYQVTGHGVFDNCVTFCCSYSRDKCTDSCIRFNSMCVITNYNASSNCGIGGGSGFSLRNAPSSTISYINVVDLTDSHAVEDANLVNSFYNINFINTTMIISSIIYLNKHDVLTLYNCIFINPSPTLASYRLAAFNTFSDSVLETIPVTNNIETIHFQIICKDFDGFHQRQTFNMGKTTILSRLLLLFITLSS